MEADEQLEAIRTRFSAAGYEAESVSGALEQVLTDLEAARAAADKANALEAEAADGRSYRADLLAQALAEGVRALGDKFNRAMYEAALKAAPLETIRQMRDDWAAVAAQRFQPGRQTVETARNGKTPEAGSLMPDSAYKS